MGLYDRDYVRESWEGGSSGFGPKTVTSWLILVNVVVFVLQMLLQGSDAARETFNSLFQLHYPSVIEKLYVWQLVTMMFLHGGLFHILFNMLFLHWFGREVESIYGTKRFLRFYLVAGICASIAYLLFWGVTGPEMLHISQLDQVSEYTRPEAFNERGFGEYYPPAVGASGAVMGVVILFAFHFPYRRLVFFLFPFPLPIQMQVRWLAILFVAMDLSGLFSQRSGIAHAAHLGGALYAFLYWQWLKGNFPFSTPPQGASKANLEVVRPRRIEDPALKERVDDLLMKIAKDGMESLTPEEQKFLQEASRTFGYHLRKDRREE